MKWKETALFSGDTLFLGDVGRPDLAQKGANMTQEELAGFYMKACIRRFCLWMMILLFIRLMEPVLPVVKICRKKQ
jgi:hypothetical protein